MDGGNATARHGGDGDSHKATSQRSSLSNSLHRADGNSRKPKANSLSSSLHRADGNSHKANSHKANSHKANSPSSKPHSKIIVGCLNSRS